MGLRNQVGRHGDTKSQSGAVPILLLALLVLTTSPYSNLGVLQGLNPQPQLLIASVYHSATSAVAIRVRVLSKEGKLGAVLNPTK
jgi:hypothetical protein